MKRYFWGLILGLSVVLVLAGLWLWMFISFGEGWVVIGGGRFGKIKLVNPGSLDKVAQTAQGWNVVSVSGKKVAAKDLKYLIPVVENRQYVGYYAGCTQYRRLGGINYVRIYYDRERLAQLNTQEAGSKLSSAFAQCILYASKWDRINEDDYYSLVKNAGGGLAVELLPK